MADTYTSSLRIVQQEIGANENTWGTINNAALARLDQAIAGIESISVQSGNVTLTTANNTDDQARNALLIFTGNPGTTRTVTLPNVEKLAWVHNGVSDGSLITFTSGAGTNTSVSANCKALIYTDGSGNTKALYNSAFLQAAYIELFGGALEFPASQLPQSGPNILDDYEEGTFTPTMGDGTNNYTLSTALGNYTKIGDTCIASVICGWSSIGSAGASQLRVSAFPFAAGGAGSHSYGAVFSAFQGFDTTATENQICAALLSGNSFAHFNRMNDNASVTALPSNSSNGTGTVAFTVSYKV